MRLNPAVRIVLYCVLCIIPFMSGYSQEYGKPENRFNEIDTYLRRHGATVTEGYCTDPQAEQFIESLQSYKNDVHTIAEIGFNAGHSAELFLKTCSNAHLVSFDINRHSYTRIGLSYIQKKYAGRISFVEGNSSITVPQFALSHPDLKFDFIYIDGDHSYNGCVADIVNCKNLASKNTVLWIDDYNYHITVANAINDCVDSGVIEIYGHHQSIDDRGYLREWIEARYMFP